MTDRPPGRSDDRGRHETALPPRGPRAFPASAGELRRGPNAAFGQWPHADAEGFTLVEILAALAVLGLLIVALNQGVRFGLVASNVQARVLGADEEVVVARRVLRRLLAGMDPGAEDSPGPVAGPHGISFVSVLPTGSGSGPGAPAEAVLGVDDTGRLMLRWRPWLHATLVGTPPPMTETELLRRVERLDLAYWRSGSGWTTAWHGRALPTLIRIRLVFAAGDPRHWPDVVVAPLLDRY